MKPKIKIKARKRSHDAPISVSCRKSEERDFAPFSVEMDLRNFLKRKKVSGCVPEFGAIFMSNRSTLKECFEKKLLGLPNAMSGFVSRVKAGMPLFLFEFEQRKLHGVFQATSDGSMDIVPHAYVSSGRSFPAQVKFTTIWHCDPLLEDEFRDAIRDNYFNTHKFNFGLSKEQVGHLMWLFNSKSLKIPRTPCHKRKNRKQDAKSIKDGKKKRRFAKIETCDSDITVPEVERHFLSSDPCSRNFEGNYFDHDAYDPENPGIHHSVVSKALSAASHESHEHLTLQSEKDNFHISAEDTEEYIPLCLPDHSVDSEVEGFDFGESSGEEQIELDVFVGNKLSFIPVPQLPQAPILRDEGYNQNKTEHQFQSSLGSPCYRLDDSSYVVVSEATDFQSKDTSNDCKSLMSKGMYSDTLKKGSSVFSRLSFPSKGVTSKTRNDISVKLVNDLSRATKYSRVECGKTDEIIPQKYEIEDPNMDDRASEYFPMISALYTVPQQLHPMTGLKEGNGGLKKSDE